MASFKKIILLTLFLSFSSSSLAGGTVCETTQDGLWSAASTWISCDGSRPGLGESVIITHAVIFDTGALLNDFTISGAGDFDVAAGSWNIGYNNGSFDVSAVDITLLGDLSVVNVSNQTDRNMNLGVFNGGYDLSLETISTITFNSVIGGLDPLATISTTGVGSVVLGADSGLNAEVVDIQMDIDNAGFDLSINNSSLINASSISGVISDSGDLVKSGAGELTLSSNNTMTGDVVINAGTLKLLDTTNQNPIASATNIIIASDGILDPINVSSFIVANGQTLSGSGLINNELGTNSGAIISPGSIAGTGILSSFDALIDNGSQFNVTLNNTTAGTGHDQLSVVGDVIIDGATLNIIDGITNLSGTNQFVIINNDSTDSILGPGFSGLSEGSIFIVGSKIFSITYQGGDGNDVVVTANGPSRLYVDQNVINRGPGCEIGQCWSSAFTNLQDALVIAGDGTEIWVAQGVYYPDVSGGDPEATFTLNSGVKLYGGFNGTESVLNQRDPSTYLTIISGDLDDDDTNKINGVTTHYNDLVGINSYHLFTSTNSDDTTLIDGITLTAGWAADSNNNNNRGSAIYCSNSTLRMNNIIVQGNRSNSRAAIWACVSEISQSAFINNFAPDVGAVSVSSGSYTDVVFTGNVANGQGSLFYMGGGYLNLTRVKVMGNGTGSSSVVRVLNTELNFNDVLFSGNRLRNGVIDMAGSTHGLLNNITLTGNRNTGVNAGVRSNINGVNPIEINNSIFWNNRDSNGQGSIEASIVNVDPNLIIITSSIIQGSGGTVSWTPTTLVDGGGNFDIDPLFVMDVDPTTAPTVLGDARLQETSMAIDTGDNNLVISTIDLGGRDRIVNTIVDMGAYEYFDEQVFKDGFE
jgi:autotransporter-associated beta strand protein